ncbi:MAG: PEP-CTERM sorting domain-containing protein [Phycisphaerales bacterium]|nr:PEP-CTERM sorting domain-containing protein [Phycisphaerales bacterium]
MKTTKTALIATAVLVSASAANALGNQIWFETADGLHGGPGQILELVVDTAAGPSNSTFDIVAKANVDQTAWLGFAIDLRGSLEDSGKLSADNWTNLSPFTQTGLNGIGGDAPDLMTDGRHYNFIGGEDGTFDLFSFALTKEKLQGDTNISLVEFVVGANEFAQDDFAVPIPTFDVAGNGVIEGSNGTSGGTAIRIINIPEPSTWALLSFGAIALIRRSRR